MSPKEAPGSNGMTVLFFKHFCNIVGPDVISVVQAFFFSDCLLPKMNQTNLVLIPNIDKASKVSQFRPISLCKVIYKLIFKILAKRLKGLLPKLISPFSACFCCGKEYLG